MKKIFVLSALFIFLLSSCAPCHTINSNRHVNKQGLYGKPSKEKMGPAKVKHRKTNAISGLYGR